MTNENDLKAFMKLSQRFIHLANKMKDEGKPLPMINAALMSASATYGTFIFAGNAGYLKPTGVDKLVETFRLQVENLQRIKQQAAEAGVSATNGE
ncbi:MAG: DUF3144 domain-containing protein [Candidatus Thiodiazotropha sp.]|jgi:hypothetical protein